MGVSSQPSSSSSSSTFITGARVPTVWPGPASAWRTTQDERPRVGGWWIRPQAGDGGGTERWVQHASGRRRTMPPSPLRGTPPSGGSNRLLARARSEGASSLLSGGPAGAECWGRWRRPRKGVGDGGALRDGAPTRFGGCRGVIPLQWAQRMAHGAWRMAHDARRTTQDARPRDPRLPRPLVSIR
jgi:hypothetical protein